MKKLALIALFAALAALTWNEHHQEFPQDAFTAGKPASIGSVSQQWSDLFLQPNGAIAFSEGHGPSIVQDGSEDGMITFKGSDANEK